MELSRRISMGQHFHHQMTRGDPPLHLSWCDINAEMEFPERFVGERQEAPRPRLGRRLRIRIRNRMQIQSISINSWSDLVFVWFNFQPTWVLYLRKDASQLMLQSQWRRFLSNRNWRNLSKEAREEGRLGRRLCWMLSTLEYHDQWQGLTLWGWGCHCWLLLLSFYRSALVLPRGLKGKPLKVRYRPTGCCSPESQICIIL